MDAPSKPISSPLVVLSPHRDDAAFSASCLLFEAASANLFTTVLNLFTQSGYAPFTTAPLSPDAVTALRLAEDQAVLRLLGPSIHLRDLELFDAPLRLQIPDDSVLQDPLSPADRAREARAIAASIPTLNPSTLLVLPLSIGNHIDHRIGRDAGLHLLPPGRLAFYQDLPYASRIPSDLLARETEDLLTGLEKMTGTAFRPHIVSSPNAAIQKHRVASCYPSQVSPETVEEMTDWSGSLEGEMLFASTDSLAALHALLPSATLTTSREIAS